MRIRLFPTQALSEEADTFNVNAGGTAMLIVSVAVQPKGVIPVTVYIVVIIGLTVTVVPLRFNGCQVYEFAPLPISEVVPPKQASEPVEVALRVGLRTTLCVKVVTNEQPLAAKLFIV